MSLAATLPIPEAAARDWGAVVVGAGPAGALAARELARRGVAVLLVDRAAFPRPKVCGCCLNGRSLATLAAVGLGDLPGRCGAVPLTAVRLAVGRRAASLPLPNGVALSREALDAALVEAAIDAGAHFLPRTRAALGAEEGGERARSYALASGGRQPPVTSPRGADAPRSPTPSLRISTQYGERRAVLLHQAEATAVARARVVLAADGLGGNLLARAGLTDAPAAPRARIGAGAVVTTKEEHYRPGTVYMACGRGGYVGLVRLEDDRLDLAAALDAAAVRAAGGLGQAAARILSEVGWPLPFGADGWRGTAPLTRRARRLGAHRVFALGDAAGYVEPFTGEGIAWALAAAAALAPLAARAADAWDPALVGAWERTFARVVRGRQLACRAAAAVLRRPWLAGAAVALVAALPALAGPVLRHLNHPTPAAEALS